MATLQPDSQPQMQDDAHAQHARENSDTLETPCAVTVRAPRSEVFAQFNQFKMPAAELELLSQVEVSAITSDESLNFVSTDANDGNFKGQLRFEDAIGDRGTLVSGVIHVDRPLGKITKLLESLAGDDPAILLRRDMRKLKQLCETGEVATSTRTMKQAMEQEGIE